MVVGIRLLRLLSIEEKVLDRDGDSSDDDDDLFSPKPSTTKSEAKTKAGDPLFGDDDNDLFAPKATENMQTPTHLRDI